MNDVKITRAFRLTPRTVEMITAAAERTGSAQGDILEGCVLEAIQDVVKRLENEKAKAAKIAEEHSRSLAPQPRRGPGRPRKEESAKLTKRQSN